MPRTRSPRSRPSTRSGRAVELTAEDLAAFDAAPPIGAAAGDRYADMGSIDL
jgi:hypothetical protein